jgi:ATP-dependent Clp protease ATP-binding subunit ClpA
MTEFPVPLDNLIAYVKTLHPGGGPLENVSDAFTVSTQLDEQADALIGYFVDQARRSGLSWSQIGGAMGVSKQAAQKRFVPTKAADLFPPGHAKPFSRFTDRAARVIAAAGKLAAPEPIGAAHLTAALLTEPEGVAAKAIAAAGLSPEQVYTAVGAGPAPQVTNADSRNALRAELLQLEFDNDTKAALKGSLRWALRLGHNYIGTEHVLLGVTFEGGPASEALTGLGLPPQRAEQLVTAELAAYQARKAAN